MVDYSWVTGEMFEKALADILDEHSGAGLLAIPGLYEVLSEHFNNDVLDRLQGEREAEEASPYPKGE